MSSFSNGLGSSRQRTCLFIFRFRYKLNLRLIIAMPRADSDCNVRHEWLLDDKCKIVMKDHSGNQKLARLKVCTDCL